MEDHKAKWFYGETGETLKNRTVNEHGQTASEAIERGQSWEEVGAKQSRLKREAEIETGRLKNKRINDTIEGAQRLLFGDNFLKHK